MMPYKEALQKWGALKLSESSSETIVDRTVTVHIGFEGGCDRCGQGASVYIEIYGQTDEGRHLNRDIGAYDFSSILGEIIAAGGGNVGM